MTRLVHDVMAPMLSVSASETASSTKYWVQLRRLLFKACQKDSFVEQQQS